jgi:hypothetical protein
MIVMAESEHSNAACVACGRMVTQYSLVQELAVGLHRRKQADVAGNALKLIICNESS